MRLEPRELIFAYCNGIFPMGHEDGINWYQPDPRAILPLDDFHISRSLQRAIKKEPYQIRLNTAFDAVIRACADPNRVGGWITEEIIGAYNQLHEMGYCHSVEAWHNGTLVGGLYGVAIQGLFAGESMFSRGDNASKIALVHLVKRMRYQGMSLLDVQFLTPHLAQFGAIEVSCGAYLDQLAGALAQEASFS